MMIIIGSVAAVCAMFAQIPHHTIFWPAVIVVAAWIVPCASIGFDALPTRRGMLNGAIVGLLLGVLMFLWLSRPVIRE